MSTLGRNGFIAYPAEPSDVGQAIETAVQLAKGDEVRFGSWKSLEIGGQLIPDQVHSGISSCSVFVADITYYNLNVAYEVGLAVGRRTPIALTKNSSLVGNHSLAPNVGVFDAIGQDSYSNSNELASIFQLATNRKPLMVEYPLNPGMPVFTVLPKSKNDFLLRVTSSLKRLKLSFRVFDAAEQSRLGASDAIQNVSESYGLVLALLPSNHPESLTHNMRSMFVAGLAVGLDKPVALLTTGLEPPPMDVVSFASECKFPDQIDETIQELATYVAEGFQNTASALSPPKTQLEKLDIGASSAENELSKLSAYYLATDAFQKTLRGEARLVVGRKGSGKSAVFFEVKNKLSDNKQKLVIDLKPDGYQLINLKASFEPVLKSGSLEHLITAFWEYVLFCEVANEYRKTMRLIARRDPEVADSYKELEDLLEKHAISIDGDFSERIVASLKRISEQIADLPTSVDGAITLTSPQVTNLVHRGLLSEIQAVLYKCLRSKEEVWILFDNVDKGWPAHGLTATDILIVRTLQDAARKVARSLDQHGCPTFTVIFLRNDVFELLVSETPDRGKEARVMLDWHDRDALKEVVRRRLAYSGMAPDRSLEDLWNQIATPYVFGRPSFEYLLDRCLMRPRFLLDLIAHCKSCAVNVGHQRIESEDIEKGLRVFSSELVTDIGFEISDVLGASYQDAGELLMNFLGCDQILSAEEIFSILVSGSSSKDVDRERVLKILLWHGVVGLSSMTGDEASYIYDFNYNYSLMAANITKVGAKAVFRINDAFTAGLQLATMA
jgi:hypothetical protein